MTSLTPFVPSVLLDWQRGAPERKVWVEDGALAFLDVSGFTAMSERLGRLGREGAEVVLDVIGSTFEELLGVAYEAGGSLLKFGGDALLLWFAGDVEAAARRACSAAAHMRSTLRRMGAIPTPLGGVRVRVSAGVHAGQFHFFVVGTAGRELVVAGPGASRTVEMEAAASAGQVLVSPETAALLNGRWLAHTAGPGVLLKLPPPLGQRVTPTLPDACGVNVESLVSTAVRRHLLEGEDEAEHRPTAVGFVHYDGTDGLIASAGVEATADALHELVSVVQAACDEHEVALLNADVDHDGGKFLLSSGAPVAVGDEDERLLRTLRRIVDAGTSLPVRAGAHRGLVFAGSVGPSYRRSYTLMGDVVNTAARVMAHAQPGQVLATRPVLDRTRTRFATRPLPAFAAKGKSRMLAPFEVGAALSGPADEAGSGLFVGRAAELDALLDALRSGGAVEVAGEPGVGKTRLVAEARSRAVQELSAADIVLRGDRYTAGVPYLPFRPVLRAALGSGSVRDGLARLDLSLAEDAPLIAAALGEEWDESGEAAAFDRQVWRARLHTAVVRVLERTFHRKLIITADDVQWMDEPSAQLLLHLGRSADERGWAVVTVRRAEPGGESVAAAAGPGGGIALGPLDAAASARLVNDRAPFPLLPRQVDDLVQRGAGNPLFLEQLAAAYDPDGGEVPEELEALVAARIDALPSRHRSWVRHLAILGPDFALEEAAVVLGAPVVHSSDLAPLAEFIEVVENGARFRQHVFQSVAYAAVSFRRRRELHERVGLHAEHAEAADVAKVAAHFALADRYDKSWKYGVQAARNAYVQHAYPEAAELYRMALKAGARVSTDPAELRAAWQGLGDALRFMGRQADAAGPYRKARMLAHDDPVAMAALCMREGDIRQRLGKLPGAVRWFHQGLKMLADADANANANDTPEKSHVRIRLLQSAGKVRCDQGRFAEAERLLTNALAEAEMRGDRPAIAHASNWLSYALLHLGDDRHEEFATKALSLYEEVGALPWEAAALNSLAMSRKRVGRWSESIDLYQRARERTAALGDPIAQAIVSYNLGDALADQGRAAESLAPLTYSLQTFEAAGHVYAAVVHAALARSTAMAGECEDTDARFAAAVERLRAAGMHSFVRETEVKWAEARVYGGDPAGAQVLLASTAPGTDKTVDAHALRVHALAAWSLGDDAEAGRVLGDALVLSRAAESDASWALTVIAADRLGIELDASLGADLMEAELVLARLGVVATPLPRRAVDNESTHSRRELCTRQSS